MPDHGRISAVLCKLGASMPVQLARCSRCTALGRARRCTELKRQGAHL